MWKLPLLTRGVLLVWLAAVVEGATIEELESMVRRNNQKLHDMSPYLVRTDRFWSWYTRSHRRLNAILNERAPAAPRTRDQLEEISQRLRLLELELEEVDLERQAAQRGRLQSLEEEVTRLTANVTATNQRNEALEKEIELGSQDLDKVLMFVRQMTIVSNNTMQVLKEQVRTLSERVGKMEENASNSVRVQEAKEQLILADVSQLKERLAALEEGQKATTEVNAFLNSSVTSINQEIKNISEKTNQFPTIESRLNLLRNKMEHFESGSNGRTLREIQDTTESKMRFLEDQVNITKEKLDSLTDQTNQLRFYQENANDTRNEIIEMKDKLEALHAQSQNTQTQFNGVQRNFHSMNSQISGVQTTVANIDGRLNNARNHIDGLKNSVSVTQSDITALKAQLESMRMTPANLEELRAKVAEIEKKVEAKSVVRMRGDELLNSITSSSSSGLSRPMDLVSNTLEDLRSQNLPG